MFQDNWVLWHAAAMKYCYSFMQLASTCIHCHALAFCLGCTTGHCHCCRSFSIPAFCLYMQAAAATTSQRCIFVVRVTTAAASTAWGLR